MDRLCKMSKLLRILRVAEEEADLLKIGSTLAKLGESIGMKEIALISRDTKRGDLIIGDKTAKSLVRSLRNGGVEDVIKQIYKVDTVPVAVKLKFLDEIKDLPSVYVAIAENRSYLVKSHIKTQLSKEEYKELSRPDAPPLTVDIVEKSGVLSKAVDTLKNTKVISIYTSIVLFGGTTALVIASINNHRRELRGCHKFTNVNGTIRSCKEIQSSCVDGHVDLHETVHACWQTSPSLSSTVTCKDIKGVGCINCPPIADISSTGEKIDNPKTMEKVDDRDLISYHCNDPSNLDAIADLLNEKADKVSQIFGKAGDAVADTISSIFGAIKYLFILVGVVAGVFIVAYGIKHFSIISNDE